MCTPAGDETDCELCIEQMCCDAHAACLKDDYCSCYLDCMVMGGQPNGCAHDCMANPPGNPPIMAIDDCLNGACADAC